MKSLRRAVWALLALLPWTPTMAAGLIADDYGAVKRALYRDVFADQARTLYCGCPYDTARRPDLGSCGYRPGPDLTRAKRVEVEHVVPAAWLGQGHACWHEKLCRNSQGRAIKGRQCCLQIDAAFRRAYQDLHNLWPAIGEVNAARRDYRFGELPGEPRAYGRCDVEIDPGRAMIEPRPAIRGDIARVHFYMAATYGLTLAEPLRRLLDQWAAADPVDDAERTRNQRIARLQGRGNPFIDGRAGSTQPLAASNAGPRAYP